MVTSLQQRSGPTPGELALVTGACLLAVAPFALGMALPYYVNDLDGLPLHDVRSGRVDPATAWPLGTVWGNLAGILALTLAQPALAAVTVMALSAAVRAALTRRLVALGFAGIALSGVAVLAWVWGPTGRALMTWLLD